MRTIGLVTLMCGLAMSVGLAFEPGDAVIGYNDTPHLPGQKWRVHDSARPVPSVVSPGKVGAVAPPSDAIVLFDGRTLKPWRMQGKDEPAKWKVQNGYAEVNGTGSIVTAQSFGDCQLHVEWATPAKISGDSQGRGNSGVFMMGRYEIQILDSYENRSYADGQAGAFYGQHPPMVNASAKPGEWQSFDILFKAPRFEGDKLVQPASATVLHNGVVIHQDRTFIGVTTHGNVAKYSAHEPTGPIMLQDHSNPIRFRNIWVRQLNG
jgi:hypothetical protein